jgi:hypothetical protein
LTSKLFPGNLKNSKCCPKKAAFFFFPCPRRTKEVFGSYHGIVKAISQHFVFINFQSSLSISKANPWLTDNKIFSSGFTKI